MSARVHSNIGHGLERQLPLAFNGNANALWTSAPNTLAGGKTNAMAIARKSGVVSFMHDGASQAITAYMWSQIVADANAGAGWVLLGAVAAEYTKTVDQNAVASITVPEGALLFFRGATGAVNFYLGGTDRYNGNPNLDLKP